MLCSSFLLCLFFTILSLKKWGVEFKVISIFVILLTLISFIFGQYIAYLNFKVKDIHNKSFKLITPISRKMIYFILVLFSIFLFFYFQDICRLSVIGGNKDGYTELLYYARKAQIEGESIKKSSAYIFMIQKSITYICIFNYIYIYIYYNKNMLYLLTPLIWHIMFLILTTGRTEFIYLISYIGIILMVLYSRYKLKGKNKTFFILKNLLKYFCIYILIFSVLGSIRDGNFTLKKILERISLYCGSSLAALNLYLVNFRVKENSYFGENTLFLMYNILRKIGFNIPKFFIPDDPIYFSNGEMTNIYGAIKRYMEDFGILGLIIIASILGFFYGKFFLKAYYGKNFKVLILYCALCFPIIEFPIEERFFMVLFPQGIVYNVFFIYLSYYILIKERKKE